MKWQELDARARRKTLLFCGVVSAALIALVWPSGASSPKRLLVRRESGNYVAPVVPYGVARRAAPIPYVPMPLAPDLGLLGRWMSASTALPKRGMCNLWLEIARKLDEPGKYTGAATLSCYPNPFMNGNKPDLQPSNLFTRLNALSAEMTGEWEKDAIAFRLDKVLNDGGCPWTAFSVSRFGSQFLSAQFQDGCGGGSMVVARTR